MANIYKGSGGIIADPNLDILFSDVEVGDHVKFIGSHYFRGMEVPKFSGIVLKKYNHSGLVEIDQHEVKQNFTL